MPIKASEAFDAMPIIKLLVYGDSGTAKTSFAAQSPAPFIICTERQAVPAINRVAPDAIIELVTAWHVNDKADGIGLRQLVEVIKRGRVLKNKKTGQQGWTFKLEGKQYGFQTLVVDSISDIRDMLAEHYAAANGVCTRDGWGKVQANMRALLRDLRSLQCNLVVIALAKEVARGEDDPPRVLPDLAGQLALTAGQYFSGVVYTQKQKRGNKTVYSLNWDMGEQYITKIPPHPVDVDMPGQMLRDINEPGCSTLGSILMRLYPDRAVASLEHDSADKVFWMTQARKRSKAK